MQKWRSPARIFGRKYSFCCCVPKFMIVGPTVLMVSIGTDRLVEEDELLDGRAFLAAPLLRPADAGPAVLAHLLPDGTHLGTDAPAVAQLLPHIRREQLLVVGAQLLAERLLLLVVRDV